MNSKYLKSKQSSLPVVLVRLDAIFPENCQLLVLKKLLLNLKCWIRLHKISTQPRLNFTIQNLIN